MNMNTQINRLFFSGMTGLLVLQISLVVLLILGEVVRILLIVFDTFSRCHLFPVKILFLCDVFGESLGSLQCNSMQFLAHFGSFPTFPGVFWIIVAVLLPCDISVYYFSTLAVMSAALCIFLPTPNHFTSTATFLSLRGPFVCCCVSAVVLRLVLFYPISNSVVYIWGSSAYICGFCGFFLCIFQLLWGNSCFRLYYVSLLASDQTHRFHMSG